MNRSIYYVIDTYEGVTVTHSAAQVWTILRGRFHLDSMRDDEQVYARLTRETSHLMNAVRDGAVRSASDMLGVEVLRYGPRFSPQAVGYMADLPAADPAIG